MAHLIEPVTKKDHIQGRFDAPVTLVEYGDYQCPYCGEAYYVVKRIQEELGDNLRFVFRNFPLKELHPFAFQAAKSAEAAALQNRFWEMHDLLFEKQQTLSLELINELINLLNLDALKFANDLESPKILKRIEDDFMTGVRSGVNGTPTFFVNDERFDGSPTYEKLMQHLTFRV